MIVGCSLPATSSACAAHRCRFRDLIDECERLAAERHQIAAMLADLPGTVGELRAALKQLAAIVGR
jgi:hypothetical protein